MASKSYIYKFVIFKDTQINIYNMSIRNKIGTLSALGYLINTLLILISVLEEH